MMDRWVDDGHSEKILLLRTLTIRGSDVASLVEFCPVVLAEIA